MSLGPPPFCNARSVWTSADGIPLRILSIEVPFKLAAEGDHTYGARSAPLP